MPGGAKARELHLTAFGSRPGPPALARRAAGAGVAEPAFPARRSKTPNLREPTPGESREDKSRKGDREVPSTRLPGRPLAPDGVRHDASRPRGGPLGGTSWLPSGERSVERVSDRGTLLGVETQGKDFGHTVRANGSGAKSR